VHVQPVGVDRHPTRQQHRLRDQRVDALILIEPQQRQPHPPPGRRHGHAVGVGPQPALGCAGYRVVRRHAQDPQRHIRQHRHKQRPRRLAMPRPRPVRALCHLVMAQDLVAVTLEERPPAHHPAHQHVLRQQHGVPHHLAFPAPRSILQAEQVPNRSAQRSPSRSPPGDGSCRMARHARQPPPGGLSAARPAQKAAPEAITTNAIVAASKPGRHSAQGTRSRPGPTRPSQPAREPGPKGHRGSSPAARGLARTDPPIGVRAVTRCRAAAGVQNGTFWWPRSPASGVGVAGRLPGADWCPLRREVRSTVTLSRSPLLPWRGVGGGRCDVAGSGVSRRRPRR
jgi:hypothetical protein